MTKFSRAEQLRKEAAMQYESQASAEDTSDPTGLTQHVGYNAFCEGLSPDLGPVDRLAAWADYRRKHPGGPYAADKTPVEPVDITEPERDTYDPPPGHYSTGAGIDPWAVWDAFDLDRYTANAVKYLLRAGKKDIAPRLDDLIKARNYINKAIEREQQK